MVGSPPPTRGTPTVLITDPVPIGITPAYAGNTACGSIRLPLLRDHPRLRGEHQFQGGLLLMVMGSPPPTRGTRWLCSWVMAMRRITPAYAGNTSVSDLSGHSDRDHPRLRGEHIRQMLLIYKLQGSPPPTRGTQYSCVYFNVGVGITPAYAGNTLSYIIILR